MPVDKIFEDADFYDPSLEYPGFESDDEVVEVVPSVTPQGCFRLEVLSSEVLPRKKRLAILDAYKQTEIGRDISSSATQPRIRLKDMEVSKVHATMFWEEARAGWAIVDMGSKHGTFITPARMRRRDGANGGESSSSDPPSSLRLSPPRQASLPRALSHGDLITLGRTTFVVHIHESGLPCEVCTSNGENEVPLFPDPSRVDSRVAVDSTNDPVPLTSTDPRKVMLALKKQLLSQRSDLAPSNATEGKEPTKYVDRSAKRRALEPIHEYRQGGAFLETNDTAFRPSITTSTGSSGQYFFDSSSDVMQPMQPLCINQPVPPAPSGRYFTPSSSDRMQARTGSLSIPDRLPGMSYRSAPPVPLSSSNIGHGLLSKLGWTPGTTLGVSQADNGADDLSKLLEEQVMDVDAIDEALSRPPEESDEGPHSRKALIEPLQVTANVGRSGLGMRAAASSAFQSSWFPQRPPKKRSPSQLGATGRKPSSQTQERSWTDIRRELE